MPTNQNTAMKNQRLNKQKLRHINQTKVVIWGMNIQTLQEEGGGGGASPGTRWHPHLDIPNRVPALEDEEEEGSSGDEQECPPSREVMGGGDLEDTVSNGRERLKRHRTEVEGRVWIPEIWGQEEFLKDWVDCTVFDSSLVPSKIMSARAALVEEGRRASTQGLRVGNRC